MRRGPTASEVFEPLWERVEGNRRRYFILIVVYVLAVTAFFVLTAYLFILGIPLVLMALSAEGGISDPAAYEELGGLMAWVASWPGLLEISAATLLLVALYTLFALGRSELTVLRRIGAERTGPGEQRETKRALYDMAIAAGLEHPPPLYVIDSPAVNAMVVGRSPRTGAIAVTRGLAARLDLDEERAVYAHLLTRLNARDTAWATVSTVLMHPLWIWKKKYYDVVPFKERPRTGAQGLPAVYGFQGLRPARGRTLRGEALPISNEMQGDTCLFFPPYVIAVIAAHYLMEGQRRSQLRSAEFADAEGLLLLKDPRAALSALRKVVETENVVRACGGQYTQFFYAWTGEASSNDESDPEYRRLLRLEQTLGAAAEGEEREDLSHLFPPRAPRVADRGNDDPA